MLSGKGFKKLYNLSGGINSWESEIAIGPQDSGMELFSGIENVEDALILGFGLEEGLREFYLQMIPKVESEQAKKLFTMLADIEIKHQEQLVKLYQEATGKSSSFEEFSQKIAEPAMEGGISTDEYIQMFSPDLNREVDILSLAMSIEAQALDLYSRAAEKAEEPTVKSGLQKVAKEERAHLESLAKYIEQYS